MQQMNRSSQSSLSSDSTCLGNTKVASVFTLSDVSQSTLSIKYKLVWIIYYFGCFHYYILYYIIIFIIIMQL